MVDDNLSEEGKNLLDKIPDLVFDWYARLIPGFICAVLVQVIYQIDLKLILDHFIFSAMIVYTIGHLIQPFSSGILQKTSKNLMVSKGRLLTKAYSELVGFFSCVLFSIAFLLFLILDNNYLHETDVKFKHPYVFLVASFCLFLAATYTRKKAYDRKHNNQLLLEQKPVTVRVQEKSQPKKK